MARSTSARPTASPYSESCPDDRFNQKMARSSPPQFPVGGDFTSPSFFLAFDTSEASAKKKETGCAPVSSDHLSCNPRLPRGLRSTAIVTSPSDPSTGGSRDH